MYKRNFSSSSTVCKNGICKEVKQTGFTDKNGKMQTNKTEREFKQTDNNFKLKTSSMFFPFEDELDWMVSPLRYHPTHLLRRGKPSTLTSNIGPSNVPQRTIPNCGCCTSGCPNCSCHDCLYASIKRCDKCRCMNCVQATLSAK